MGNAGDRVEREVQMNVGSTGVKFFRTDGTVGGFEGLVNDRKGLRGVRNGI